MHHPFEKLTTLFRLGACALWLTAAACGDDDDLGDEDTSPESNDRDASSTPVKPARDAGGPHADAGAVEPECYEHPTTHVQIINACTDATTVDKEPDLPLLLADGGLPPLP